MNICLPETQDGITALGEVDVASPVSVHVGFLNGVHVTLVDCQVAMPEVAIPLNNKPLIRIQCIHNELATDYLLLKERVTDLLKDATPRLFQLIALFNGGKSKYTIDALHVGGIVAATMRTIFCIEPLEPPSRDIERCIAGDAPNHLAAAPHVCGALPGLLLSLGGVLPSVCAIKRTEGNSAATAGYKRLATIATCVGAAIVTTLGIIRVGQKRLIALFADAGCSSDVFHSLIIPWSVAKCTLN